MTNYPTLKLGLSLQQKIALQQNRGGAPLSIFGLSDEHWNFLFHQTIKDTPQTEPQVFLWVSNTSDAAERFLETTKNYCPEITALLYPGLEANPYHSLLASERNLFERFRVLDILSRPLKNSLFIFTTTEALFLQQPHQKLFHENRLALQVSDIVSPDDLARALVKLGFSPSTTVEEPGTFARKGEIFDLYPVSHPPVRLHYFDDMIEEIFLIDMKNQKTLRTSPLEKIEFGPCPQIFAQTQFSHTLRENIPMPKPQFKAKFEERKRIFASLQDGQLFENYAHFVPLFCQETESLFEAVHRHKNLTALIEGRELKQEYLEFLESLRHDFGAQNDDLLSENILPNPERLYQFAGMNQLIERFHLSLDLLNIDALESEEDFSTIQLNLETPKTYFSRSFNPTLSKAEFHLKVFETLKENFKYSGDIYFVTKHESSKSEIEKLILQHEVNSTDLNRRIHFIHYPLASGFYYDTEKTLVLSESDLFSAKQDKPKAKTNKTPRIDLFAEQLATLKPGDYVIHTDHGLGEYKGLESMEFGGVTSDYLVLSYADNDKVYVPVYKLNLIQKHAEQSAGLKPESLRSNKFQAIKSRAKNSAKKLAFDLLRLQAERQSAEAFSFSPPDEYFEEFENAFPFDTTPDQTSAIENVLEAMQKPHPMDHLVCGDVGFGKTEVAMRAAFKAVLDKKQVAVLVPTTILAFQHFNSFTERFKKFPIKIEFISRFKSAKETTEIRHKVERGEIDILIGTHKILSDQLKFQDLGLVIVDEEQRFGVGHKEKLKLMKASVDFLTLTATPIPRTLQLAFLGLRDMSLIQTPPPRRQSIKSYIIKEDDLTIQSALKKEIGRGGQAFIVHNRVNDIEDYAAYIRELIPEASIVYAHGQLPEKELESRMRDFYNGKYQILISTTIIESGIDIPNANTMIVDRADMYGLSQLHQLRGRIGRSEKKAYAYFVVPKSKMLTPVAEKRLKALQTYADIGSGFNIATSDLEIRGAGDILGGEQSGHVEAVGLELYMELLKEAIAELNGEQKMVKKDVEISSPHAAYIPNNYLTDSATRLKTYKRLSNCSTLDELVEMRDELSDIYGQPPIEILNLFSVLEVRLTVQRLGLKSIQVAGKVIIFNFEKSFLEANEPLRNKVVEVFLARPKIYQFSPGYKVTYQHKTEVDLSFLVEFAKDIAQQILPC